MRKSFKALSRIIEGAFPEKLLTGALLLFLNRRRNLIKIVYWECDYLVIWYKRLELGHLLGLFLGSGRTVEKQFTMLLEGIVPRRLNKRFPLC